MRSVRFIQHFDQSLSEVEVESDDRSSVLPLLQASLHRLGLCVIQARSRVSGPSLFERVELGEADGSPLSMQRYLEARTEILNRFVQSAA
jgi:hypothetical protein